jgi:hypothetical protein
MGIGSNWGVELEEQKYKEALFEEVINEASALVALKGYSREDAYQEAKELVAARQEALSNDEYSEDEQANTIEFFDSSLEGTTIPKGKEVQIKAIAKELYQQFEYDS